MLLKQYCTICEDTDTPFDVFLDPLGMGESLMIAHMRGRHGHDNCKSCGTLTKVGIGKFCANCIAKLRQGWGSTL